MNFITVAGLTYEVLTAPDSKTYDDWGLFWTFWLATPFFLVSVIAAGLRFRFRDEKHARVLHRLTLGGLVIGIVITSIGVRL